jgi:hyperosmotically inducible protein
MRIIIFSLLLVFLVSITGCETTGSPGSSDIDSRPADPAIESAVKTALQQDGLLASANIQVNADEGVVTLSGTVPNATAYLRALRIARDVDGVRPPVKAIDLTYPQ